MHQAEGFHKGSSNKVYRLCKLLYGLKKAARQWNNKLHNALTTMGFNDWNPIDPSTSSFVMMFVSLFLSSLMISSLLCQIPLPLTLLSKNYHPTLNYAIWDLPPFF
jgi:Reverse transcriptase (RNA-dependent DNA polymerase)